RLGHRNVRLGRRRRLETALVHVADDTDDRAVAVESDGLADRVLARKELLCRRLIDDEHLRRAIAVGLREEPAANQRNAERLVIVRRHADVPDALACRTVYPSRNGEAR